AVYTAGDMVVIASLHTEASPIVLREAFASGRSGISTNRVVMQAIIGHRENGLLIEPGDSKAVAAAILEFLSDPKFAAQCAANGLRYANEHFSFDRMMDAKVRVDASLIRRRKTRPLSSSGSTERISPPKTADLASRE